MEMIRLMGIRLHLLKQEKLRRELDLFVFFLTLSYSGENDI